MAALAISLATALALAPTTLASFSAPVRVGFAGGDDWEPATAADAYGHVYVVWSHYVGFEGSGSGDPDPTCPTCASPHTMLQVSADGGATFGVPRALVPSLSRQDDPQVVIDPADGRTVYAAFMQDNKSSEYVAKSTDFGQTWDAVLTENLKRGTDKDILAARDGNVYLLYHTTEKIFVSVSHDGGAHWSLSNPLKSTTNSTFGVSYASGGAVAPDGTVYFALNGVTRPGQAKGTVNLYVIRSADGGATWSTSPVATSSVAPDCNCAGYAYWSAQMALDVDDAGVVYVLWNANSSRRAPQRVYFSRSTNGGQTWSAKASVSTAATGIDHVFPALVAGAGGDVRIGWMDDRNGPDSGSSPDARWNTWYRSSANGGTTWSAETQVSAYVAGYGYKLNTPDDGYLQPYGDYFEMAINNAGDTVAAWGEGFSYTGPGNIWFARQP